MNPLTFSEMADKSRQEWKSRLKINELSEITVETYLIRINVLEEVFGNKTLLGGGSPIALDVVRRIMETFGCDYIQT